MGKVSEIIGISREIALRELSVLLPGKTLEPQNKEKKGHFFLACHDVLVSTLRISGIDSEDLVFDAQKIRQRGVVFIWNQSIEYSISDRRL